MQMICKFSYGVQSKLAKLAGVSHSLIQDAMLVFAYARELVDEVIGGGNPDLTLTDGVRIARGAQ